MCSAFRGRFFSARNSVCSVHSVGDSPHPNHPCQSVPSVGEDWFPQNTQNPQTFLLNYPPTDATDIHRYRSQLLCVPCHLWENITQEIPCVPCHLWELLFIRVIRGIRVRSIHIEIRSKILSANPVTCSRHIDHPTSARIPILEIFATLSEPFPRPEPTLSEPILPKNQLFPHFFHVFQ